MESSSPSSRPSYQPTLSPKFIASALNLSTTGKPQSPQPFTTITTDSRKIQPGCLFVAIKGEKFDGHDFIAQAVKEGASGVLCRRGAEVPIQPGLQVYQVEDTLAAYRQLGAKWRKEFAIPVIAVAGSVGKTTTKEILSAILQGKWPKVLKTVGSQNGFVGIPMTLLEIRPEHGVAVIEVGIDEMGAMEKHMPLVSPTASVLTAIGPEHLEKLRDVPTVAREESVALTWTAASGGLVAINLDDPWIRPHFKTLRGGQKVGFTLLGEPGSPDIRAATLSSDGSTMKLDGQTYPAVMAGHHNASNLLAALTVALGLGLTPDEIRTGLKTFKGADGRSELRELPGKTPVVCDYYNANPTSVEAGLELLTEVASRSGGKKVRWACLADMLELGREEERFHRDLAAKIIQLGIEHVFLFGGRMGALAEELKERGYSGDVAHFGTHGEMARAVLEKAKPGDALLIKGSRGMRMEEVWKILENEAKSRWK